MKNFNSERPVLAVIAIVMVGMLGACGNSQDEKMEKAMEAQFKAAGQEANVEVNSDGTDMHITMETEEGSVESSWSQDKLPEGFPDDVPLYDDAELTGGTKISLEGFENYSVQATTSDSVGDVQNALASKAADEGWEQVMSQNMQGMVMLMYQKDSRRLSYNITTADGKTNVIVTVGEEDQ